MGRNDMMTYDTSKIKNEAGVLEELINEMNALKDDYKSFVTNELGKEWNTEGAKKFIRDKMVEFADTTWQQCIINLGRNSENLAEGAKITADISNVGM